MNSVHPSARPSARELPVEPGLLRYRRIRQASSLVVRLAPGLALAVAIAAVARAAGSRAPTVGAPVVAIVAGMIVAAVRTPRAPLQPGVRFASTRVLQASIVVLGLNLSLGQVLSSGGASVPVLLASLTAAFVSTASARRALRLEGDLPTLIGVGTAVCGASAIAAASSATGARSADVSYAMTTIFVFNVMAVLIFPPIGRLLGLSGDAFGVWAGTAVNDTSSVVAAASAFGDGAATTAVVVKLTRTLAIIPICVFLAVRRARAQQQGPATLTIRGALPRFIGLFLACVVINSVGLVPESSRDSIKTISSWLVVVAIAGVGLTTRVTQLRQAGARPLAMGAIVWITIATSSLAVQALTGSLS